MSASAFDGPLFFVVVIGKLLLACVGLGLGAIGGVFVADFFSLYPAVVC